MFDFLLPTYRVAAVQELTPARLREIGVESLLLDADCTLKRYRSEECESGVIDWLAGLRAAGIGRCLVSNGLGDRIERFAKRLELPFIARALKPMPWGCRRALREMGFDPAKTAMVGDQVFADIAAGGLARLTTILVDPLGPYEEPWFTRAKRGPERWLLQRWGATGKLRGFK